MINYSYNPENGIITTTRSGEVDIAEACKYVVDLVEDFKNQKCLYIIEDNADSVFIVNDHTDLLIFVETIKKQVANFDKVMAAIVTKDPHNTAISMVFKTLSSEIPNFHVRTFSTVESAEEWLILFIPD